MAKINISDMMDKFDEMDSLLDESEVARQEAVANANKDKLTQLILESFQVWFNRESCGNLNSTYLKGRSTKVPDKNFTKMINALAPSISRDDILVLADTTFVDADEGMIITSDKVYFKNYGGRGEINIRDITSIYTKSSFWGSTIVDITDTSGKVWHLGQVSALKDRIEALDDAFRKIITGVKSIYNER